MSDVPLLVKTVSELEVYLQELSRVIDLPERQPVLDHFQFRHANQTNELAVFLKAVRVVSLLNASLVLLREGYIQEVHAFCRLIDETVEDITFLSIEPKIEEDKAVREKFLKEFYQEQFAVKGDPMSSIDRATVPRRRIRAALSRIEAGELDQSTTQKVSSVLYDAFSGAVHGTYESIMELFGGYPPRYHANGMIDTPPHAACEANFLNHLYRGIMSVEAAALMLGNRDIASNIKALSKTLYKYIGKDEVSVTELRDRLLKKKR